DGGNAGLALDFLDLDAHFLPHIGIAGRTPLVKEKHHRLENNGTRKGNARLLPARKLRGQLLLAAGKPDHFQGPANLAGNLGLGYVAVFQPERDIVENILVWKQSIALEDQPDIALVDRHVVNAPPADRNPALGDVDQARDRAQNGGFAASRGSEKRDETSLCDCQGQITYLNELAIGDLDIAKLDRRLRRTVSCWIRPGRNRPGRLRGLKGIRNLSKSCPTAWSRRLHSPPSRSGRRRSAPPSSPSDRTPEAS